MCVLREMIKFLFTIYLSQNCYVNYFFLDEKVTKNQGLHRPDLKNDIAFRYTKKTRFAQTVFCA